MNIFTLAALQRSIQTQPELWRPLVFTNGCFDLLHAGHVRYLAAAKAQGYKLIVGLNSDESVRQIKPQMAGQPSRPIIPEAQRAEVLAALRVVDGVVIFPETTAINILAALQPDIYIKGGDYSIDSLPEAPTVLAYGGKIKLTQIEISSSTSGIIRQILAQH